MAELYPHAFDVLDGFKCRYCGLAAGEVDDESYCPERDEPLTVEVA